MTEDEKLLLKKYFMYQALLLDSDLDFIQQSLSQVRRHSGRSECQLLCERYIKALERKAVFDKVLHDVYALLGL